MYSIKLYTGITTSTSSAFSINTLLIFDMQLVNGALFLNAKDLFLTSINYLSASFVRVIVPLTTIYASLKSHRSDQTIDVLNLICLLGLYLSSALPSGVLPNKFVIFWYSIFIWYRNNLNSSITCCFFFLVVCRFLVFHLLFLYFLFSLVK